MIKQIRMPAAGQTTDVATIGKWCVKKGDVVKRGDVLLEAETDKAVLPVESFAAGTVLQINFAAGDEVSAGDVLALVGDAGDLAAAETPAAEASAKAEETAAPEIAEEDEYIAILPGEKKTVAAAPEAKPAHVETKQAAPAMPNAKKLARETGVDLSGVTPSNGQFIKAADVRVQAEAKASEAAAQPANAPDGADDTYTVQKMSNMRAIIGRRMLESVQTIPSFNVTMRVDMRAAMRLKEACQAKYGVKISYNDLLAKALAVAAKKFPLLNARFESNEIRVYNHTNVGLAVGIEAGLLVPVVKHVEQLSLQEIAKANKKNIENARAGKVPPSDMGCGSVTISNLGMFDVTRFEAIINPPESCILAVGRIETCPVWDGGAFIPVPIMSITGSFDHRIFDGSNAAQMLKHVKELLEQPELMIL